METVSARARFDIYGRMQLLVEQDKGGYRMYILGADGKRRLFNELTIPDNLTLDELASYLDDMLHELAKPGQGCVESSRKSRRPAGVRRYDYARRCPSTMNDGQEAARGVEYKTFRASGLRHSDSPASQSLRLCRPRGRVSAQLGL